MKCPGDGTATETWPVHLDSASPERLAQDLSPWPRGQELPLQQDQLCNSQGPAQND